MTTTPPILFHFDYVSPYAYLAWTQLGALAARHDRRVEPVPTLFAALLNAGGQKGPAEILAKRAYLWKDTLRTARVLGVPFSPPKSHPFNPLLPLRATGIVDDPAARARLIDALYRETWGGGAGVASPEVVVRCAGEAGLDGAELVRLANEEVAKRRLRTATDEAIAAGVFGVPTMRVGDELFWGYDSFGHLGRFLRGEDPIGPDDLQRWQAITPSATRS